MNVSSRGYWPSLFACPSPVHVFGLFSHSGMLVFLVMICNLFKEGMQTCCLSYLLWSHKPPPSLVNTCMSWLGRSSAGLTLGGYMWSVCLSVCQVVIAAYHDEIMSHCTSSYQASVCALSLESESHGQCGEETTQGHIKRCDSLGA